MLTVDDYLSNSSSVCCNNIKGVKHHASHQCCYSKKLVIVYLKIKSLYQMYEIVNIHLTYKSFIATTFFCVECLS